MRGKKIGEIVYLILDRNYGEKIINFSKDYIVWICNSETNEIFAKRLRSLNPLINLTLFDIDDSNNEYEMAYEVFPTILEHHPNCKKIDVRCNDIQNNITDVFAEFGFKKVTITNLGFTVSKE